MTTFIVEDGTGVPAATSYVSSLFADGYLGAGWAPNDQAKEQALIAGSEYADARWGSRLKSSPLSATQGLEFPRISLTDRYGNPLLGVPANWLKAVCLYASYSNAGTLYPANQTTAKDIKKKKTVVGPITTEVEYQGSALATSFLQFPLADRLAKPYTYTGSGVGGVTR